VLPSKIHACIESGKNILFVGSEKSDVHLLASSALTPEAYRRVDVSDVEGVVRALNDFERAIRSARSAQIGQNPVIGVGMRDPAKEADQSVSSP
jgi:hypothetical protein